MTRRARPLAAARRGPVAVAGCAARSSPTRRPSAAAPSGRDPRRRRGRRPAARRAARATTAPHDRLTEWWYYTGHLRRRRRPPVRVRAGGLPGRARRVPGRLGVAPRADRRDAATVPLRPAQRDRAAGGPLAAGRAASTWRWAVGPDADVSDPTAGALDDGAARDGERPARSAVSARRAARARSGSTSTSDASGRPSLHDSDRLDRLRAGRRLLLLLAHRGWPRRATLTLDGDAVEVDGQRLVRPPVGRLHRGRRRRLGLVRGQPRRRHGPHAVAGARRGRLLSAGLRHARRPDGSRRSTCGRRRSRSTSTSRWTSPTRAPTTRRAGGSRSRARRWSST